MGRPGVTYREVANAANELSAQGKNPTIEQVRLLLGSGSSSTLAVHLRQWKSEQGEAESALRKENIPQELISVIKGLWERVITTADEKIAAVEEASQKEIDDIRTMLSERDTELKELTQRFDQLQQTHQTLTNDNLVLQSAVNSIQKENATLASQYENAQQQIAEKTAHNQELANLHTQSQKNLEHYREATREQRILDQQRYEQQHQQQEMMIQQLQQKLQLLHDEKAQAVNLSQQLIVEKTALQQSVDHLSAQLNTLQHQLTHVEAERNENQQAMKHWQQQWQVVQNKQEEMSVQVIMADKEVAILAQQVAMLQKEITGLTDQNKLLAHDKWVLVQEKAQLEGQLRQMEKIVA